MPCLRSRGCLSSLCGLVVGGVHHVGGESKPAGMHRVQMGANLNLVWLLTVTQRFPKLYAQIAGQSRLRLLSYNPSDVCGLTDFHRKCGLKQPEWLFNRDVALMAVLGTCGLDGHLSVKAASMVASRPKRPRSAACIEIAASMVASEPKRPRWSHHSQSGLDGRLSAKAASFSFLHRNCGLNGRITARAAWMVASQPKRPRWSS